MGIKISMFCIIETTVVIADGEQVKSTVLTSALYQILGLPLKNVVPWLALALESQMLFCYIMIMFYTIGMSGIPSLARRLALLNQLFAVKTLIGK